MIILADTLAVENITAGIFHSQRSHTRTLDTTPHFFIWPGIEAIDEQANNICFISLWSEQLLGGGRRYALDLHRCKHAKFIPVLQLCRTIDSM